MAPFLTVFFLFFSLNAEDPCTRSLGKSDQELYRTILLKADDAKTKLKYLKKFGNCMNTPGISVFIVNGIPVVERLQCGNIEKRSGMEFFFKDSVLCTRSVNFFPSRKVFVIKDTEKNIGLTGSWKFVKGDRDLLIYDSSFSFKEEQDPKDRILTKNPDGSYTDSIGKKMHPSFVFEEGSWKNVTPLRELFDLSVEEDGSFKIELITESAIPFVKEKLLDAIGLKAESAETSTPTPSRYFIKGKKLKAVRIPSLNGKEKKTGFNGRYLIKLRFPGIDNKPEKTFKEKNFEIKVVSENSSVTIDLVVKSRTLLKNEIKKIRSILDNITPLYHSQGKDGKN